MKKIFIKIIISILAFFGIFLGIFLIFWLLQIVDVIFGTTIKENSLISLLITLSPWVLIPYALLKIWKKP